MNTSSGATSRRINWPIALGVLVVVLLGAWVGSVAGRLAHRAPRATGLRVAVLPPDTTALEDARGLDRFVAAVLEAALVREFAAAGSQRHVVPLAVVRSKLEVMRRGGREGTLLDAADVLDVDVVVSGRVTPADAGLALSLQVGAPGSAGKPVLVTLPGQDPVAEMNAAVAPILALVGNEPTGGSGVPGGGASLGRGVVSSAAAFGAFTQGLDLFEDGHVRAAAGKFSDALAADPRLADAWAWQAVSWALLRDATPDEQQAMATALTMLSPSRRAMGPVEQLLADALLAWSAWQGAAATDKAARGEEVFAALRALTVQFPEERLGHLFLGRAYVQIMNGPTEALRHFENARRLSPTWFPTVAELVDAWLKMGDRKHATAEIRGYLVYRKDDDVAKALLKAIGD